MDDRSLLNQFLRDHSSEAFGLIVRRYADLVYSAARRQLGNDQAAQDAGQAVFILLAKKAGHVRGTLPGWLIATTHLVCCNARKLARRRMFHERRAAQMRPEIAQPSDISWDEYSHEVDQALSELRPLDRDAVVLRYLQGKSLREVGDALGIGEDAARKRVDRGMDRLRQAMATRVAVPGVAMLAVQLGTHGVTAAPAAWVSSLVAGGVAAKTSAAAALAHHATRALMWARMKIGAMVLLGASATGGGIIAVAQTPIHLAGPPKPEPIVLADNVPANSAAPTPDSTPAPAPAKDGDLQLASWDMLLSQSGADAINRVATPITTDSKLYQAMTGNAFELRQSIADVMTNNGMLASSDQLRFTQTAGRQTTLTYPSFRYAAPFNTRGSLRIAGDFRGKDSSRINIQELDGKTHLKITDRGIPISMSVSAAGGRGAQTNTPFTGDIVYEGDLTDGSAVAFMAPLPLPDKTIAYQLWVVETFHMPRSIMLPLQNVIRNSDWWCQNGPENLRKLSEMQLIWEASAAHPANNVPDGFTQKLSDGKEIRLMCLSDPGVGALCWWDPNGLAVSQVNFNYSTLFQVNPSKGLRALVQVRGDASAYKLADPATQPADNTKQFVRPDATFVSAQMTQLAEGANEFQVMAEVGPWEEIGQIHAGDKLTVDGVEYTLAQPQMQADPPNSPARGRSFSVRLTYNNPVVGGDVMISAVGPDGTEPTMTSVPPAIEFPIAGATAAGGAAAKGRPGAVTAAFSGLKPTDVQYYRLVRRKLQTVTFKSFALQPKTPPSQDYTPEQVAAAEESAANARLNSNPSAGANTQIDLRALQQAQISRFEATPPDPKTAMGMLRLICVKAAAGDEQGVRALMITTNPKVSSELLDEQAKEMTLVMKLRKDIVSRFGSANSEDFTMWITPNPEADFTLKPRWATMDNGDLAANDLIVHKQPDGAYILEKNFGDDELVANWTTGLPKKIKFLQGIAKAMEDPNATRDDVMNAMVKAYQDAYGRPIGT